MKLEAIQIKEDVPRNLHRRNRTIGKGLGMYNSVDFQGQRPLLGSTGPAVVAKALVRMPEAASGDSPARRNA